MREKTDRARRRYTTCAFGLFALGFILLVLFGAQSYLDVVSTQKENDNSRAVLAYLSSAVRAYDAQGRVTVEEGPQGDALVLSQGSGDEEYQRRIYIYNGSVVEEYVRPGAGYDPENSQAIGSTDRLDVEKDGGLLRISTGEGNVLLSLRSEVGG